MFVGSFLFMSKYKFETIEGTNNYVEEEILEKFPDSNITSRSKNFLEIESDIESIDDFRILLSALRVENEQGKTFNLFRRDWRKDSVAAGINPALAYVMCRIADIKENETVSDPFCGGGTIAITAALYFPHLKTIASDISGKAVDISKKNFENTGLAKEKYFVLQKGVRDLRFKKDSVEKIITNLPFGIRAGTHDMNDITYKNFYNKANELLKVNGKIIALTQEKELFRKYFNNGRFKVVEEIAVNQGGLRPNIFVVVKV